MSSAARLFGAESKARELVSSRRRIVFVAFLLLLLFAAVAARLFNLQVVQYSRYSTLARENHVRLQLVPPPRGRIYSSDNVLLAGNLPSHDLMLYGEYLDEATRRHIATVLREILPQLDLMELVRKHAESGAPKYEPILLWPGLDDRQRDWIAARKHGLPGLELVSGSRRFYPLGEAGLHLLGYVSGITAADLEDQSKRRVLRVIGHSGRTGVELEHEDWLRGVPGSDNVEVDASGRSLRVLSSEPFRPGSDLHLSIDASLQLDAYHALAGRRGAVVAIEVPSGKVRALVSSPAADPNSLGGSAGNTSGLGPRQGNLFNRALTGQYPPASTIKPFFALAGLYHDADVVHDSLWCNGSFTIPGAARAYRDWKAHGHVDLRRGIAASCDVFYYKLALELGVERSGSFLRRFGFGAASGLGLPGEKGGLVPSDDWKRKRLGERWYAGDSVSYGIGQGYFLVTPMQLAVATARLFSGKEVAPALLQDSEAAPAPLPGWDVSPDHLRMVREGMRAVVHGHDGTARAQGRRIDFTMAGKTGTAQVVRLKERAPGEPVPEQEQDHSLFIAYGPIADEGSGLPPVPPLAMAVVVENAGGGSKVAAPMAVALLKAYVKKARDVADSKS